MESQRIKQLEDRVVELERQLQSVPIRLGSSGGGGSPLRRVTLGGDLYGGRNPDGTNADSTATATDANGKEYTVHALDADHAINSGRSVIIGKVDGTWYVLTHYVPIMITHGILAENLTADGAANVTVYTHDGSSETGQTVIADDVIGWYGTGDFSKVILVKDWGQIIPHIAALGCFADSTAE